MMRASRLTAIILGAALAMAGHARAEVTDSLIGHWKLDESSGDAFDSSGNDNAGTLSGDPTWQPTGGRIDGALEFDGSNDYVEVANESAFDIYDEISVSTWVKVTDGWCIGWQAFVSKGGESSQGWQLRRKGTTGQICFTLRGTSAIPDPSGDETTIGTDGLWPHFLK